MAEINYDIINNNMKDLKPNEENRSINDVNYRLKAGIFFTSVTAISAVVAFAMTLASVKRRDPAMFEKGTRISLELQESGVELATRALKWATFYSISGSSLIFYGIWKLSGASNMEEFKYKMGSILPKIHKNVPPQGRTEFSGLNDLLKYISEDYEKDIKKIDISKSG